MTEVELAKQLKASNYTCEGVSCDECKKTNYLHVCLMADVRLYCSEIFGLERERNANYTNKLKERIAELEKTVARAGYRIAELKQENDELKEHCKAVDEVNIKMRRCQNCKNYPKQPTNTLCKYGDSCGKELDKWELAE